MCFLFRAADFPPAEGDRRSPAVTNYGQGRLGLGLSRRSFAHAALQRLCFCAFASSEGFESASILLRVHSDCIPLSFDSHKVQLLWGLWPSPEGQPDIASHCFPDTYHWSGLSLGGSRALQNAGDLLESIGVRWGLQPFHFFWALFWSLEQHQSLNASGFNACSAHVTNGVYKYCVSAQ